MPWSALTLPKEPVSNSIPVRLPDANVPDGGLPSWALLPNDAKLPLPRYPRSDLVLSYRKVGRSRYQSHISRDFDLNDPLRREDLSLQYKPLYDPNLRDFFTNTSHFKNLVRQGEVTPDGRVKCTLAEYNEYRRYLYKLWGIEVNWLTKTQLKNEKMWMQSQLDEFLQPTEIKIPEYCENELRMWERRLLEVSAKKDSFRTKVFHDVPDHSRTWASPASVAVANERLLQYHTDLEKLYKDDYPAVAQWLERSTRGYRNFKERQLDDRKIRETKMREHYDRLRERSLEYVEKELEIRHKERVWERKLKNKRHRDYQELWDRRERKLAQNKKRRKSVVQHECDRVGKRIMKFRAKRVRGLDDFEEDEYESAWDRKQTIRSTLEMIQGGKMYKGKDQAGKLAKEKKETKVRFEDKATMTEDISHEEPDMGTFQVETKSEDLITQEKLSELQTYETEEETAYTVVEDQYDEKYITPLDMDYEIAAMTVSEVCSAIEEHLQHMFEPDLDASTLVSGTTIPDSPAELSHDNEGSKLLEATAETETILESKDTALYEIIAEEEMMAYIQSILDEICRNEKMAEEKKEIDAVVDSLLDDVASSEEATEQTEFTKNKYFMENEVEMKAFMQAILDKVKSSDSYARSEEKLHEKAVDEEEITAVVKSLLDDAVSVEKARKQAEFIAYVKLIQTNAESILAKISDTEETVLPSSEESIESLLNVNLSSLQKIGYTDAEFLDIHEAQDIMSILNTLKQMLELIIEKSIDSSLPEFEKEQLLIILDKIKTRILQCCEKANREREANYFEEIKSFFYTNILEWVEKEAKTSTAEGEILFVPPSAPKDQSSKETWGTIKVLEVPDDITDDTENLENQEIPKEMINMDQSTSQEKEENETSEIQGSTSSVQSLLQDSQQKTEHDHTTLPNSELKLSGSKDGIVKTQEEKNVQSTMADVSAGSQRSSEENMNLTEKLDENVQDKNVNSNSEKSYSITDELQTPSTTQTDEEKQITQEKEANSEDVIETESEEQKERKKSDKNEYIVNFCECFYYPQVQNNEHSKHLGELQYSIPNNSHRTLFYKLHEKWHLAKIIQIMPSLKECQSQFKSNGPEEPQSLPVLKLKDWNKFEKDKNSIAASDFFKFPKDKMKTKLTSRTTMRYTDAEFQAESASKNDCSSIKHSKLCNKKEIDELKNERPELKQSLQESLSEKQTLLFEDIEISILDKLEEPEKPHIMNNVRKPNGFHIVKNKTESGSKAELKFHNKTKVANCDFYHSNYHDGMSNPPRNGGWTLLTHWRKNAGDLLDLEYKEMALKVHLKNKNIKPLKAKEQLKYSSSSILHTLSEAEREQLKYRVHKNFISLSNIDVYQRYMSKRKLVFAITDSETCINLSEDSLEDLNKDIVAKRDEAFMLECSDILRNDMNGLRADIFNRGRKQTFEDIVHKRMSLKQAESNEAFAITMDFGVVMTRESQKFNVRSTERLKDHKRNASFPEHAQVLAYPVNAQFNITIMPRKSVASTSPDNENRVESKNNKEQSEVISHSEVINLPLNSSIPIHHTSKFSKTVKSKKTRFNYVGTVNIAVNSDTTCHHDQVEKRTDAKDNTIAVGNSNSVKFSSGKEKNIAQYSLGDQSASAKLSHSKKLDDPTTQEETREGTFKQPTSMHHTPYIRNMDSFPERSNISIKTGKLQKLEKTSTQEETNENSSVQSTCAHDAKDIPNSIPETGSASIKVRQDDLDDDSIQEGTIKHLLQQPEDICYIMPKITKSDTSVESELPEIDDVCKESSEFVTEKHNELFFPEMNDFTKDQYIDEVVCGIVEEEEEPTFEIQRLTQFKIADLELVNVCSILPTGSGEFLQTNSLVDQKILLTEDNFLTCNLNKKDTQDQNREYLNSPKKASVYETDITNVVKSQKENFNLFTDQNKNDLVKVKAHQNAVNEIQLLSSIPNKQCIKDESNHASQTVNISATEYTANEEEMSALYQHQSEGNIITNIHNTVLQNKGPDIIHTDKSSSQLMYIENTIPTNYKQYYMQNERNDSQRESYSTRQEKTSVPSELSHNKDISKSNLSDNTGIEYEIMHFPHPSSSQSIENCSKEILVDVNSILTQSSVTKNSEIYEQKGIDDPNGKDFDEMYIQPLTTILKNNEQYVSKQ